VLQILLLSMCIGKYADVPRHDWASLQMLCVSVCVAVWCSVVQCGAVCVPECVAVCVVVCGVC